MTEVIKCHCGKPLHYKDAKAREIVDRIIKQTGHRFVNISVEVADGETKTWSVDRHYIALHGLKAKELPGLGFEEVK